jgi:hypothetical protein
MAARTDFAANASAPAARAARPSPQAPDFDRISGSYIPFATGPDILLSHLAEPSPVSLHGRVYKRVPAKCLACWRDAPRFGESRVGKTTRFVVRCPDSMAF